VTNKSVSLLELDAAGKVTSRSSPLKGTSPRGWFGPEGAFLAATEWRGTFQSRITVARVDGPSWKGVLGPAGGNTRPRLVASDSTLLAIWERMDESWLGKRFDAGLCWATLDARSGRLLHAELDGTRAIGRDGYAGVTRIGESFVIAHQRAGRQKGIDLLTLRRKGDIATTKALSLGATSGGVDLASTSKNIGLVTERDGHILWALVAPDGRILRGPALVSAGLGNHNRKPRVAFGHGLFAIVWERHPQQSTHAAVVDRFGNVSPAIDLAGGAESSTAAITIAPGDAFMTSVTRARQRVELELLRCASALRGAPQRLVRSWASAP
jgi:hypothetical protein